MADFNAYPALDVRVPPMVPGPDLGSVFEQANKIQAGRNENSLFPLKQQEEQNKLSLFPMQQEAFQTENAYNKLILGEAQQAQKYAQVQRGIAGIDDDSPDASNQFDQVMSALGPEGKQWIGKYSIDNKKRVADLYGGLGAQSASRVRAATAVAQQQSDGIGGGGTEGVPGSAFAPTGNQKNWASDPKEILAKAPNIIKDLGQFEELAKSNTPAKTWKELQDKYPDFKADHPGPYSAQEAQIAVAKARAMRSWLQESLGNAQHGVPNPQEPLKFQAIGGSIFSEDQYDRQHPLKEVGRGYEKPNWQLDTYTEKNGETYPVYHDTTSGKQRIGDFPAVGGKYDTKSANAMSPEDRENAAQEIYHNVRKISDFAKTEAGGLNTRVKQLEESGTPAFGTTGKAGVDMSVPGYTTKPVTGAGGLTQATIDEAAPYYASGLGFPAALGLGSAGPTGAQKQAIMNRAAERFPGADLASNKAQAAAMIAATKKQVDVATTTERSLNNFDATFQDLVDKFKGKVNLYDVPFDNLMANPVKYQIDPDDVAPFRASLNEVQREYNQINTRGGQLTDLVRKTTGDILPNNLSFNTMQKVHDALSSQGRIILKGDYDEVNKVSKMFSTSRSGTPLTPGSGLPVMSSPAEARQKLKPGDHFKTPDGRELRVPN